MRSTLAEHELRLTLFSEICLDELNTRFSVEPIDELFTDKGYFGHRLIHDSNFLDMLFPLRKEGLE